VQTLFDIKRIYTSIHESVDLLGFRSLRYLVRDQVSEDSEAYEKNNHRHIVDIGVYAYLRGLLFSYNEDIGAKGSKSTGSYIVLVLIRGGWGQESGDNLQENNYSPVRRQKWDLN